MRSIYLPLNCLNSVPTAIQTALSVGREFGSHLLGHHVKPQAQLAAPYAFPIDIAPHSMDALAEIEKNIEEHSKELKSKFESCCSQYEIAFMSGREKQLENRKVTAEWKETNGPQLVSYVVMGRVSDVAVVDLDPQSNQFGTEREMTEAMLFGSGHPVIVTSGKAMTELPLSITIAWDGKREAAKAVSAALPILEKAASVNVVTVAKEQSDWHKDDKTLEEYLLEHGIKSTFRLIPKVRGSTARALIEDAVSTGSDLLVMGAYSHSRWVETILGGVTHHALHESQIPIFMAH